MLDAFVSLAIFYDPRPVVFEHLSYISHEHVYRERRVRDARSFEFSMGMPENGLGKL